MRCAVIGSRSVSVNDLGAYLPEGVTEIVSGGARGVDLCARSYAQTNGVKLTEFLPEYELYKRYAPLKRNERIVDYADTVVAFWDGMSRGTKHTIDYAVKTGKACVVYIVSIICDKQAYP